MRNKVEITGVNTLELKVIPQEEMMDLIKKSQAGDRSARDMLVEGNLKLVLSVIKKFNNRGEDLDDLFQVGAMGLLHIKLYNLKKNSLMKKEKNLLLNK